MDFDPRSFSPAPPFIAALYVQTDGCYANVPGVEVWDEARDGRLYAGPHPVVAHPPCKRWGRYWHGSPRKPHRYRLGDDGGCFEAALILVREYGGILEHPADSHAWAAFRLNAPPRAGGWIAAEYAGLFEDETGGIRRQVQRGYTCHVEQGHYGHFSRKPTWLYAVGCDLPDLIWGPAPQRLHPTALARHGYTKARRIGVAAMIGGKNKTRIREATPPAFRDILLSIARTATSPNNGLFGAFR